ncbi:MAG TPA: GNAT family N-acetyltransferase [Arenibaculum sp.]|nr:GNAT family N-acetyltransferase [Arenibaculum sp.]
MAKLVIRGPRQEEFSAWETLWQGYQEFYEAGISDEATRTTWRRFFDPAEPVNALVAEGEAGLVGIVHYLFHRSTWTVGDYCYLQDLFVGPAVRGSGIGRRLIQAVYDVARDQGCSRVYWLTHETNAQARHLYDGVADRSGFIQYRRLL